LRDSEFSVKNESDEKFGFMFLIRSKQNLFPASQTGAFSISHFSDCSGRNRIRTG